MQTRGHEHEEIGKRSLRKIRAIFISSIATYSPLTCPVASGGFMSGFMDRLVNAYEFCHASFESLSTTGQSNPVMTLHDDLSICGNGAELARV